MNGQQRRARAHSYWEDKRMPLETVCECIQPCGTRLTRTIENSFKVTGLPNMPDGTDGNALWKVGDSNRDEDSESAFSTTNFKTTIRFDCSKVCVL